MSEGREKKTESERSLEWQMFQKRMQSDFLTSAGMQHIDQKSSTHTKRPATHLQTHTQPPERKIIKIKSRLTPGEKVVFRGDALKESDSFAPKGLNCQRLCFFFFCRDLRVAELCFDWFCRTTSARKFHGCIMQSLSTLLPLSLK